MPEVRSRAARFAGVLLALASGCVTATEIPAWTVSRLVNDAGIEAAQEVIAGTLDSAFENVRPERITRREASMWLRVRIERPVTAAEPFVLVLRDARTARATLFPPSGKPVVQSLIGDEPLPRFTRDAHHFPLGNSLRQGDSYYIHLEKLRAGAIAVDIQDMAAVNAANLVHMRTIALTIGAVVAMGLIALLMWTWIPERGILYFGCSATLGSLYLAFFFGEGYAWFRFASESLLAFNAVAVLGAVALGFDILFFRELLDFGRYARRVSVLLKGLAIFFFAEGAMLFAAGGELLRILAILGNVGVLVVVVVMVPALVIASIRGGMVARLLLGAWSLTMVVAFWQVVALLRGEPSTPALYYGFPIAIVIGDVLKACALAERLRLQRGGRAFVAADAPDAAEARGDDYESVLQRLKSACAHAAAVGPTTVINVRIDDAKQIAATHGEVVLRACLAKLRARIRHALRDDDTLGSVGAAELLVVMPGANAAAASAAAERIRRRVSESLVHSDGISLALTVSVGLAWTQGVVEIDSLMAQAEAAAATADNAGGNQVVELAA